jgi:hypothetical protein
MYMGDPHIKPSNIDESDALVQFVIDRALEHKINILNILGDLWDTHSVVNLRVTEFWEGWFNILRNHHEFRTIILVGNHDLTGDYSSNYSALHPFLPLENKNFKIVAHPHLEGLYGYLPYIHDNNKFVEYANHLADKGAKVLISHPNFEGAVYDNGSPLSGGISDNSLDPRFLHLIGGHIHTERSYGRVWYTGNPRWLNKSCSNKDKGVWLVDHDDITGAILSKKFISTESVCQRIVSLTWKEGEDRPIIPAFAKVDVELHGSSDWVSKQKLELKGLVSLSSKITDTKKSKERKSGKSLVEFLSKYYQAEPEKIQKLIKYLGEMKLV